MNKIIALFLIAILCVVTATAVSATTTSTQVRVHAVDPGNNDLVGVVVAPEWKASFTGWNDFLPKEKTTGSNGMAGNWFAVQGLTLQVNYATLDGYTCTRGADTRITATSGMNTLTTVCTQNPQVPEFGAVAGCVAIAGAILGIVLLRKH